jgi:F0F1-type ATP synthase assembly protein I
MVASASVESHVPPLPDAPRRPDQRERQNWASVARETGPLLGIGASLAVSVLVGVLAGKWADAHWGREPLFTILGAMLGLVLGMYQFVRTVMSKRP